MGGNSPSNLGSILYEERVRPYLPLVRHIAYRYRFLYPDIENLVSEGKVALLEASRTFNSALSQDYKSYAACRVRQKIFREIQYRRIVRIPVWTSTNLRKIRVARAELKKEMRNNPGEKDIADRLGISVVVVRNLAGSDIPVASMNEQLGSGDDRPLEECIADSRSVPPWEEMDRMEFHDNLETLMDILSDEERKVVEMRFGFSCEKSTLQEIGQVIGKTKERVRQIELNAINKMKVKMGERP